MKFSGSTGCPFRRALFDAEQRQCDGSEFNGEIVQSRLQQPLRHVQTWSAKCTQ